MQGLSMDSVVHPPERSGALSRLARADAHLAARELDEAEAEYRHSLDEATTDRQRARAHIGRVMVASARHDWKSCIDRSRAALELLGALDEPQPARTATALHALAVSHWHLGEKEAADEAFARALDAWPKSDGWRASRLLEWSRLSLDRQDATRAVELARESHAITAALSGTRLEKARSVEIDALLSAYRLDEAHEAADALMAEAEMSGRANAAALGAAVARAEARYPDGARLAGDALSLLESDPGQSRLHTRALWESTESEKALGRLAEAEQRAGRLLELHDDPSSVQARGRGRVLLLQGSLHLVSGRVDEAARNLELASELLDEDSPRLRMARISVLRSRGQTAEALRQARALLADTEERRGPDHPSLASALSTIGELERRLGSPEAAEDAARRALALVEPVLRPHSPTLALLHGYIATSMMARGREAWALRQAEQATARAYLADGTASLWTPTILALVARLDLRAGRLDRAEAGARQCVEEMERIYGLQHRFLFSAVTLLGDCCAAVGKSAEAHRHRARADELRRRR